MLKSQMYLQTAVGSDTSRVEQAVKAGCKAVCLTLGADPQAEGPTGLDWTAIDALRKGINVPFLLKGIASPEEAKTAVGKGIQGIVVSSYAQHSVVGITQPMQALPAIADAAGGKATILVDGSFRRGSDVLKGIALGAQAVLLGRPPLWALAGYGAEGVQTMLELLQSEMARNLAQCGRANLAAVDRTMVRIHRR